MGRSRISIKVSPAKSKGGTIIAKKRVAIKKSKKTGGRPMFQTKAQMNVHLSDKNGEQRT